MDTVVANRKQVRRRKHKRRIRAHLGRRHIARTPSSMLEQVHAHTNDYVEFKSCFVNIELDFPENPCFARVWTFRHWLDKDSPLLKPSVKKYLEGRHNMWPLHMRNHATLRKSLVPFTKILCNLSGVCGDSQVEISARRKYLPKHIMIGYKFAENVFVTRTGTVRVNFDKTNEVNAEIARAAEPLLTFDDVGSN